jgi:hypothetical protein
MQVLDIDGNTQNLHTSASQQDWTCPSEGLFECRRRRQGCRFDLSRGMVQSKDVRFHVGAHHYGNQTGRCRILAIPDTECVCTVVSHDTPQWSHGRKRDFVPSCLQGMWCVLYVRYHNIMLYVCMYHAWSHSELEGSHVLSVSHIHVHSSPPTAFRFPVCTGTT